MKFLHLNFLPRSSDVALLVLRLWYGLALLMLYGRVKATGFSGMANSFPDPLGIGHTPSLALAIFGEVVCTVLLVIGAFTRVAALGAGATMFVAFWFVMGHRFTGEPNGQLPYLFLGACVALFIAGAGKYSVDAKIGAKT